MAGQSDQTMAFPGGTKLGPYEILASIGAGGMGESRASRGIADYRLLIAD